MYDGPRPLLSFPGAVNDCHYHGVNGTFQPMRKQGAIILGTGGDNSNGAIGNFYEGVMATGVTSASVAIYYSTRQSTITTITTIRTPLGVSHLRLVFSRGALIGCSVSTSLRKQGSKGAGG